MLGWFRKNPQKAGNDKVRLALWREGDDGTQPRHVRHYVYALQGAQGAAAEVEAFLRANGLGVAAAESGAGFIADETREVASRAFDDRTDMLARGVLKLNWKYDGWDCAVTANGARQT